MSAVYQSTVGDMSVNCRWHIGQLSVAYQSYVICIGKLLADTSVKYRSSIGQLSAKCRPSVCEVSVTWKLYRPTYISTDYRLTIDRLSTECRPSVDRQSTECRSTVDRVSTATSTDIAVDIAVDSTYSKHDPILVRFLKDHAGLFLLLCVRSCIDLCMDPYRSF